MAGKNIELEIVEDNKEDELEIFDGNEIDLVDQGEVIVETEESKQLRERVQQFLMAVNEGYWHLAESLAVVQAGKHYKVWGYSSFEQYLAEECGLKRGKGYALAKIFHYFSNQLKVQFNKDKEKYDQLMDGIKEIGWAKARRLATDRIIKPDNVDLVLEKAKNLSLDELEVWVKAEFKALPAKEQEDANADNNVKMVRKSFQLTIYQSEMVEEAIEKALASLKEGATPSSALTLICQDFLQSASECSSSADRLQNIALMLGKAERALGLSLVAYDESQNSLLYGEEHLAKIAESIDLSSGQGETASEEGPF